SMYLEIVFAIGVGLFLDAIDAVERGSATLLAAALLLTAEAVALTFTRAGLMSIGATLAIASFVRYCRGGLDGSVRALAALDAAIVILFLGSRSTESLRLRLTSEGQEAWYRAEITAPQTVSIAADDVIAVPVAVANKGRLVWDSSAQPPLYFSYHWLTSGGDRVVAFEGLRTPFDAPVRPGDVAALTAHVRAPQQPGEYRLVWDLVQEGRLWFSTEPGASAQASRATIEGDPAAAPAPTFAPPKPTVRPGRLQLWRAAVAMFAAHPVFGVGPDNFRLSYGRYAGIATPDTRTHSNNMYLEVLAGTGIAGAFVLAWLAWAARGFVFANIGIACAIVAIAVHGMVDSFLSFAPTYILFAMTLGLAVVTHEDRV